MDELHRFRGECEAASAWVATVLSTVCAASKSLFQAQSPSEYGAAADALNTVFAAHPVLTPPQLTAGTPHQLPRLIRLLQSTADPLACLFVSSAVTVCVDNHWLAIPSGVRNSLRLELLNWLAQTGYALPTWARAPAIAAVGRIVKLSWMEDARAHGTVDECMALLDGGRGLEGLAHNMLGLELGGRITEDIQRPHAMLPERGVVRLLMYRDVALRPMWAACVRLLRSLLFLTPDCMLGTARWGQQQQQQRGPDPGLPALTSVLQVARRALEVCGDVVLQYDFSGRRGGSPDWDASDGTQGRGGGEDEEEEEDEDEVPLRLAPSWACWDEPEHTLIFFHWAQAAASMLSLAPPSSVASDPWRGEVVAVGAAALRCGAQITGARCPRWSTEHVVARGSLLLRHSASVLAWFVIPPAATGGGATGADAGSIDATADGGGGYRGSSDDVMVRWGDEMEDWYHEAVRIARRVLISTPISVCAASSEFVPWLFLLAHTTLKAVSATRGGVGAGGQDAHLRPGRNSLGYLFRSWQHLAEAAPLCLPRLGVTTRVLRGLLPTVLLGLLRGYAGMARGAGEASALAMPGGQRGRGGAAPAVRLDMDDDGEGLAAGAGWSSGTAAPHGLNNNGDGTCRNDDDEEDGCASDTSSGAEEEEEEEDDEELASAASCASTLALLSVAHASVTLEGLLQAAAAPLSQLLQQCTGAQGRSSINGRTFAPTSASRQQAAPHSPHFATPHGARRYQRRLRFLVLLSAEFATGALSLAPEGEGEPSQRISSSSHAAGGAGTGDSCGDGESDPEGAMADSGSPSKADSRRPPSSPLPLFQELSAYCCLGPCAPWDRALCLPQTIARVAHAAARELRGSVLHSHPTQALAAAGASPGLRSLALFGFVVSAPAPEVPLQSPTSRGSGSLSSSSGVGALGSALRSSPSSFQLHVAPSSDNNNNSSSNAMVETAGGGPDPNRPSSPSGHPRGSGSPMFSQAVGAAPPRGGGGASMRAVRLAAPNSGSPPRVGSSLSAAPPVGAAGLLGARSRSMSSTSGAGSPLPPPRHARVSELLGSATAGLGLGAGASVSAMWGGGLGGALLRDRSAAAAAAAAAASSGFAPSSPFSPSSTAHAGSSLAPSPPGSAPLVRSTSGGALGAGGAPSAARPAASSSLLWTVLEEEGGMELGEEEGPGAPSRPSSAASPYPSGPHLRPYAAAAAAGGGGMALGGVVHPPLSGWGEEALRLLARPRAEGTGLRRRPEARSAQGGSASGVLLRFGGSDDSSSDEGEEEEGGGDMGDRSGAHGAARHGALLSLRGDRAFAGIDVALPAPLEAADLQGGPLAFPDLTLCFRGAVLGPFAPELRSAEWGRGAAHSPGPGTWTARAVANGACRVSRPGAAGWSALRSVFRDEQRRNATAAAEGAGAVSRQPTAGSDGGGVGVCSHCRSQYLLRLPSETVVGGVALGVLKLALWLRKLMRLHIDPPFQQQVGVSAGAAAAADAMFFADVDAVGEQLLSSLSLREEEGEGRSMGQLQQQLQRAPPLQPTLQQQRQQQQQQRQGFGAPSTAAVGSGPPSSAPQRLLRLQSWGPARVALESALLGFLSEASAWYARYRGATQSWLEQAEEAAEGAEEDLLRQVSAGPAAWGSSSSSGSPKLFPPSVGGGSGGGGIAGSAFEMINGRLVPSGHTAPSFGSGAGSPGAAIRDEAFPEDEPSPVEVLHHRQRQRHLASVIMFSGISDDSAASGAGAGGTGQPFPPSLASVPARNRQGRMFSLLCHLLPRRGCSPATAAAVQARLHSTPPSAVLESLPSSLRLQLSALLEAAEHNMLIQLTLGLTPPPTPPGAALAVPGTPSLRVPHPSAVLDVLVAHLLDLLRGREGGGVGAAIAVPHPQPSIPLPLVTECLGALHSLAVGVTIIVSGDGCGDAMAVRIGEDLLRTASVRALLRSPGAIGALPALLTRPALRLRSVAYGTLTRLLFLHAKAVTAPEAVLGAPPPSSAPAATTPAPGTGPSFVGHGDPGSVWEGDPDAATMDDPKRDAYIFASSAETAAAAQGGGGSAPGGGTVMAPPGATWFTTFMAPLTSSALRLRAQLGVGVASLSAVGGGTGGSGVAPGSAAAPDPDAAIAWLRDVRGVLSAASAPHEFKLIHDWLGELGAGALWAAIAAAFRDAPAVVIPLLRLLCEYAHNRGHRVVFPPNNAGGYVVMREVGAVTLAVLTRLLFLASAGGGGGVGGWADAELQTKARMLCLLCGVRLLTGRYANASIMAMYGDHTPAELRNGMLQLVVSAPVHQLCAQSKMGAALCAAAHALATAPSPIQVTPGGSSGQHTSGAPGGGSGGGSVRASDPSSPLSIDGGGGGRVVMVPALTSGGSFALMPVLLGQDATGGGGSGAASSPGDRAPCLAAPESLASLMRLSSPVFCALVVRLSALATTRIPGQGGPAGGSGKALAVLEGLLTLEYDAKKAAGTAAARGPAGAAASRPANGSGGCVRTPSGLLMPLPEAAALAAAMDAHATVPLRMFRGGGNYDAQAALPPPPDPSVAAEGVFGHEFLTSLLLAAARSARVSGGGGAGGSGSPASSAWAQDPAPSVWGFAAVVLLSVLLRPGVWRGVAAGLIGSAAPGAARAVVGGAFEELGAEVLYVGEPTSSAGKAAFGRAFLRWVRAVTGRI